MKSFIPSVIAMTAAVLVNGTVALAQQQPQGAGAAQPGPASVETPAAPVTTAQASPGTAPASTGQATSPQPSCLPATRQLPPEAISSFLANPPGLLKQFPMGGGGLSGQIRALIATAPDTLEAVWSLLPASNEGQKASIAAGAASAALACVATRPEIASNIQARAAAYSDREFVMVFLGTTGGTAPAATGFASGLGTGGGGGGPAPSLGTGFAPGAYGGATFEGATNARTNLFNSVVGSSSDSTTAARGTTLAATGSVSPSRP